MFARYVSLGIGAGLVSALLFGVVATGSPPGMLLAYIAPLPIVIVALGWNHLVALLGAAIGALAISFLLRSSAGLAYAVSAALPAWWLGYLTLLGHRGARDPAPRPATATGDWYPLGHLLLWTGLTASLISVIAAVGLGRGDYALYNDTLTRVTEGLLRLQFGIPQDGPLPQIAGVSGAAFSAFLVEIAPAVGAAVFTVVLVLNLWAGAKVVQLSGRLPRPWRPLSEARMPLAALGALAGGFALSFLPGYPGLAGRALSGALSVAFALQGLAFLHHVLRGRPGRGAMLGATYVLTIFFGGTVLPLASIVGILDVATSLRRRLARGEDGRGPPSPNRT